MRYLTVDEVLEINAELMGGQPVLRDRGLLESAVARPQATAYGANAYPDLVSKASALLHSLVLNHAFLDGNKRTALVAMLVFLDLNGHTIRWSQDEALQFMLDLADSRYDIEAVTDYLRSKIHPIAAS